MRIEKTLADGRRAKIRMATASDAGTIASEHPLPRAGTAPDVLYRRYYLLKALLYARAPMAGIATAWVDESLAGFVFYCEDLAALRKFLRKLGTLAWISGLALRGWFGYSLTFWLEAARWCRQHFRRIVADNESEAVTDSANEVSSWVGTVHTVDSFRRIGVASQLLDAVEGHLFEVGDGTVALWVAADNEPAQNLYNKRGYLRRGRVSRIGEDCWLMLKRRQRRVKAD